MHRATEWLYRVQSALTGEVEVQWRLFSLSQINHSDKNGWRVWEQPLANPSWRQEQFAASLLAFWSAEAARRQGEDAFRRYHLALLRERHQRGSPLDKAKTLRAAAEVAGLDVEQFEQDRWDTTCLDRLAYDHTQAVALGVFGTPTFVFPNALPVYLKLDRLLMPEESLEFWRVFYSTAVERPYVLEIKRPH